MANTPNKTSMNKRRLRALASRYRSGKLILIPDMKEAIVKTACGTVGCIAAEAVMQWVDNPPKPDEDGVASWHLVAPIARDVLGLSFYEGEKLFQADNWPSKLRLAYSTAASEGDRQKMKQIMADRIEHFVKTGGD
jgi:hypothetical protein